MKYLKIQNDGTLDIRLVALMGGTTKANDKYKIGQFGTGLKYTLAYLFRNNLDFKIFCGSEEVKLSLEVEEIRGQRFEIICINGHRTSITTQMGEDWTAWMIIREIWCNALDEGGAARETTGKAEGQEGKTIFYIQVNGAIEEVLKNWSTYFLHDQEPISDNTDFSLYPGGNSLRLYKNGVLIFEDKTRKGIFAYDSHSADINELREFRGTLNYEIVKALSNASEKAVTYFFENITPEFHEGEDTFDYNWYVTFGATWRSVLGTAKLIHRKALETIQARDIDIDTTNIVVVPKGIFSMLTKQFEGIGAITVAAKAGEFYETFNEQVDNKIRQGITILESCDYIVHPELQFKYGFFEDKQVLARVDIQAKIVYISNALLARPLFDIVSTLIEENEHFNTGMADKSREFQQHFIDLYTRQLLATNAIEI